MQNRITARCFQFVILMVGVFLTLIFFRPAFRSDPTTIRKPLQVMGAIKSSTASPDVGRAVRESDDSTGQWPSKSTTLKGDVAREALQKSGQYESLGEALSAARHAIEKIDPAGSHSRGASHFVSNPKQQLRAWFQNDAIELASGIPSRGEQEEWKLKLRLSGVGRDGTASSFSNGIASSKGNRLQVEFPDLAMTQWFENREDGLEQGFTLHKRPNGAADEVSIRLSVEGSLRVAKMESPDSLCFVDSGGSVMVRYVGLKAWDATGRLLPSRMEMRNGGSLALAVDDAGAQYPLTIDPMFATPEARLLQESIIASPFGYSLSVSGNTAVVGVPMQDTPTQRMAGGAYVFFREGSIWTEQARLAADDASSYDLLGVSVAVDGDTILVGAANRDDWPTTPGAQAVYVFVRSGTLWSQQAKLRESPLSPEDNLFGASVALSGNTALVGAPGGYTYPFTNGYTLPGNAYVFERTGTTWTQQATLTSVDVDALDQFGYSVSLDQNTAVVGAFRDDTAAGTDAGSAFVFVRNGAAWSQQAKLAANNATVGASFGFSVAVSGNTALVGAANNDYSPSHPTAERAYVFTRSGSSWSQQAALVASDGVSGDRFGIGVALNGNTAVVGASWADTAVGQNVGKAYVYVRSGTVWSEQAKVLSQTPFTDARFGKTVATSGSTVVIGADTGGGYGSGGSDRGSACVFVQNGVTWDQQAVLAARYAGDYGSLGSSVAMSGDTALIGAPWEDTAAGEDTGGAYIFVRKPEGWVQTTKLTAPDGAMYDRFGDSVSIDGDNALIGAPWGSTAAGVDTGCAHVFTRSGNGWIYVAKLQASNAADSALFGDSVSISGETAVVGAYQADTPAGQYSGSAYVFSKGPSGWFQQAELVPSVSGYNKWFGGAVAVSGETVLAGTSDNSAFVFTRNGGTWTEQARLTAGDGSSLGSSVALDGDTALIGAEFDDTTSARLAGSAYVFVRNGTSWTQQAKLTANNGEIYDFFGGSVALEGDTALVGAYRDSIGPNSGIDTVGSAAGSAHVFRRNGNIWTLQVKITSGVDSSTYDDFGYSVALGDNLALIGASGETVGGPGAGAVYSFILGDLPSIVYQPLSRTVVPNEWLYFSLWATGAGPLQYKWRKNGEEIPGETSSYIVIPSAQVSDQGTYDCMVSNTGGIVTSAPAVLTVNILSQLAPNPPDAIPPLNSVIVNVTPAGVGGWRFAGEYAWRPSGSVEGVPTGERLVEFMPVGGYTRPPPVPITVANTDAVTVAKGKYIKKASGSVSLKVVLDAKGPVAQWRLYRPGANSDPWKNSGATVKGLPVGVYHIECKPLAARITPPPQEVELKAAKTVTIAYRMKDAPFGTLPSAVPFESLASSVSLPYSYVGQIRSDQGYSSGFVVKSKTDKDAGTTASRVVATAGHVVFDDKTKAFVGGLQWLLQRDSSAYEPEPLIPRGAHLLDDYAAARIGATPGIGTETSQNRDAAALYFSKDAGRGGYSGLLASDAVNNEFLITTPPDTQLLKMLVGYPVDSDEFIQGKMHASPPTMAVFSRVAPADNTFRTYRSTDLSGSGGMSGGPLCVQVPGGNYLPAAIYVGGSNETIVRAIDGEVIELIERAEASSATGDNNNGGYTLSSYTTLSGGSPGNGKIRVIINPQTALDAGAGWRIYETSIYTASILPETFAVDDSPYTLHLKPISGFQIPPTQSVRIKEGKVQEVTYTYSPLPEIEIATFGGPVIPDGGSRNLGAVVVGSGSESTFTIRNKGYDDIVGLIITKDGANAADFAVTQSPVSPVAGPSGSTTFKVDFSPRAIGSRTARFHIASNDADEASYDITVTGTGLESGGPKIAVEDSDGTKLGNGDLSKSYGPVVLKNSVVKTFTIQNLGDSKLSDLSVSRSGVDSNRFTSGKPIKTTLAAGERTTFKVTFQPAAKVTYNAALLIASNDADDSPFEVRVTGKGITKTVAKPGIDVFPSWRELAADGVVGIHPPVRERSRISVITFPDGKRYRMMTVETFPGEFEARSAVEVSSNLLDWQSGPRHTTILVENPFFLKVRDNTPFTAEKKRFIRLTPP